MNIHDQKLKEVKSIIKSLTTGNKQGVGSRLLNVRGLQAMEIKQ